MFKIRRPAPNPFERVGSITTLNEQGYPGREGAVPFTKQDLSDLLQNNPEGLEPAPTDKPPGAGDIYFVPGRGGNLLIRWCDPIPYNEYGNPQSAALNNLHRFQSELARLQSYGGIVVPAHTSFIVEKDPYRDQQPTHYTVVERVAGGKRIDRAYLPKIEPESALYRRILGIGSALCSYFSELDVFQPPFACLEDIDSLSQYSPLGHLYELDLEVTISRPQCLKSQKEGLHIIGEEIKQLPPSPQQERLVERLEAESYRAIELSKRFRYIGNYY